MNLAQSFGVKGNVAIYKVDCEGKETKVWEDHNIVVDGGRQVIANLLCTNWASATDADMGKEFRVALLQIGGGQANPVDKSVYALNDPIGGFYAEDAEPVLTATTALDTSHINLGGNAITWKFTIRNMSDSLFNITELGLFTANKTMVAYEPIRGTTVSSEVDMVLVVKWTLTIV